METPEIFEEIVRLRKARRPACLLTVVESTGSVPRKAGAKMLVRGDGSTLGSIGGGAMEADRIGEALVAIENGQPRIMDLVLTEENGSVCGGRLKIFIEPLLVVPRLVVIGRGHVGMAAAEAAGTAGFEVEVVDPEDREGEDLGQFLSGRLDGPAVDPETFILVATRDHLPDFIATAEALRTKAGFIGLLGSLRKRTALRKFLLERGFAEKSFDRVVSPVGLEIGAQTPAEIAVSVVAQLIQFRRGAIRSYPSAGENKSSRTGLPAASGPAP